MASILVVEDSDDAVAVIRHALAGHDLAFAGSLEEARNLIDRSVAFELILLDLHLPDGDGMALCSELSANGNTRIPVIFLSARQDVRAKVAAFALGAEDYIEKPCDVLELKARVAARLRKLDRSRERDVVVERGDLRVDLHAMRAFHRQGGQDHELDLSPTELRILQQLISRPGNLITRETLFQEIWGDTAVGPRTLDSHVSNLRAKLRPTCARIESVRGRGYRFCLQTAEANSAEAPTSA